MRSAEKPPDTLPLASYSEATLRPRGVVLGVGGGILVLGGLRLLSRSPVAGAALISLGAILGALPIFWALLPLLLALALIVLSVVYARRAAVVRSQNA